MRRAIEFGRAGRPSPNPHVGAVLVRGRQLLAGGHHERAGTAHAEVVALSRTQEDTRGATLYVTLEPCNHQGRTPPCTEAILKAGIARVVVGCRDPNPHVKGGGLERLRAAGVEVTTGVLQASAQELIAPWAKVQTTGMPYVLVPAGPSAAGVDPGDVDALWVSADALTGLAPDPREGAPLRVVASPDLDWVRGVALGAGPARPRLLVFCAEERAAEYERVIGASGITLVPLSQRAGDPLPVRELLGRLVARGVVSVFVDAGEPLRSALRDGGLVDIHLHAPADKRFGT